MALIKCENVSIGYEGQMVVHDLNFEINQGDYLCIVGENGSGKSTIKQFFEIDSRNTKWRPYRSAFCS